MQVLAQVPSHHGQWTAVWRQEEKRLQDEAAAAQKAKEKAQEKRLQDEALEAQKAKEKAQEEKRLQDEALEAQKAGEGGGRKALA